jgi:GGDEF domain-containing protein
MELQTSESSRDFSSLRNIPSQNIGNYLALFEQSIRLSENTSFWANLLEKNLDYDPFYSVYNQLYSLLESQEKAHLITNFFHYYKLIASSYFYDLGLLQSTKEPLCMWRKQFFIDYLLKKITLVITYNNQLITHKDDYNEQLIGLSIYNLDIAGMSEANAISTEYGDQLVWKAAKVIQETCERTIRYVRTKYFNSICEIAIARQGGDEFSIGFFGTEREIKSANRYFFDQIRERLMTDVTNLAFSNLSVFGNQHKNLPVTQYLGTVFQTKLTTDNHLVLDELIMELESGNIPEMNSDLHEYIVQLNKTLKLKKIVSDEDDLLTKLWSSTITKAEKKKLLGNYKSLNGPEFEQEIKHIVADNFIVYSVVKKCIEFDRRLSKKQNSDETYPFTKTVIETLLLHFDPLLGFIFDRGIIQFISERVPGIEYVFIDIHIRAVNKLAGHAKGNDVIDEIIFQALQKLHIIPQDAHPLVSDYSEIVQVLKKYMIFGKQGPKFIVGIIWKKVPQHVRAIISSTITELQLHNRNTPISTIQGIPSEFLYAISSTINTKRPVPLKELEDEGEKIFLQRFVYLVSSQENYFQEFREGLLLSDNFEPLLGTSVEFKTMVAYLFCQANKRKQKILDKFLTTIEWLKNSKIKRLNPDSFYVRLLFLEKELTSRLVKL